MSAKDYNKGEVIGFSDSLDAIVEAVKGDGVGSHLFDEALNTFTKTAQIMNEAKGVPAAFGLHVAGNLAMKQGDHLLAKAIAEEDAATGTPT